MMRFALLLVVLASFTVPVFAADVPAVEAFGGFSILHSGGIVPITPRGWQAGASVNLSNKIGVVADFGGQYQNGGHLYQSLFGPRFNARMDKMTFFAESLLGNMKSGGNGGSSSNFAFGLGGGFDVRFGKVIVRAIQFDWIPVKNSGIGAGWSSNNTRYGFGLVIPFGTR